MGFIYEHTNSAAQGKGKEGRGKKQTPSAQWFKLRKENISNVKHRGTFTHLCYSNIQIKAEARCSSNPLDSEGNGTTQSPTKYVTQIRKRGREKCASAPASVCALHFKLNAVL